MNRAGDYIFSIDASVPGRATGWCLNERNFQPVELRCSSNGNLIFTITACASVFIDELDEERNAGFEIRTNSPIWRLMDKIDISTPDGHLLGTIKQDLVQIVSVDDDIDEDEDERDTRVLQSHDLSFSTPQRISGHVEVESGRFHYVKLFAGGILRGYAPTDPMNTEAGADDSDHGFTRHGYVFEQDRKSRLLPRLVFIVVDDKFVFAASSQRALIPNHDPTTRVLPLHFELDHVRATTTHCDIGVGGVGLFAAKHYLGSGTRALLVYRKGASFEMIVELVDGTKLEARHSGELLVLEQVADVA